jgi:hypothetical protein
MRPIVVSKAGTVAMDASSRFEYEMPSQEEIDTYIRAREEYVATEVLRRCGWIEFLKRCELVDIKDFIHKHVPCEGPDGQCNVLCHRYGFENCWKPFFP